MIFKITIANDFNKIGSFVIKTRIKFDKSIDKDEIEGPNDRYKTLSNKFVGLSRMWYLA